MLYLKWQQIFMGLKIYSAALMGSAWLQPLVGWQIRHQVYSKKERRETTTTKKKESRNKPPQGANINAAPMFVMDRLKWQVSGIANQTWYH